MDVKQLFTALTLLLVSNIGWAQKNESDQIYCTALQQYTLSIDTFYSKYSNNKGAKVKEIFLQKPEFVDSIPSIVNGYTIILITSANQRKLYKDHRNRLTHTIMFPLTNKGSELFITITPYRGELKRNNYTLGVSDGTTIYFKFDCEKQTYVVDKVKNWGI
ncbi:hypothetical protein [Mucilaginibacter sp. SP1R1]|uniref:hypothetical protein n=1 Tax=Mucilaginibacter sp. SP1R1 TaxID=2723091 RepID=UPI00160716DD|nr:hypothetical protein [Mucilaginibacter sp. SP1R1]MBB6150256.1 hypothetical protein [Mucilaginibacter sp. SP1R1]